MTKKLRALNNAAIDAWAVVREWGAVLLAMLVTLGVGLIAQWATL